MLAIDGILFNTQDSAKKHVASILSKYTSGSYVTEPDHIKFLKALTLRHSNADDKIGSGIKNFISSRNFGNGYKLEILRTDGTKIDISYVHCITGRQPNWLLSAMRNSIRDQIIDFKRQEEDDTCEDCGVSSEFRRMEVDHKHPPFKVLANNFLKIKKNHPKSFDECPETCVTLFKQEDIEFEEEWQTYHELHATLQILCFVCNSKKGSKVEL
jgi:hypothetical protein